MSAIALSSPVIATVVVAIALFVVVIAWGAATARDDAERLGKTRPKH
jgi:hypothetical protein